MELKLGHAPYKSCHNICFNRTFMELKLDETLMKSADGMKLLIVPLWN